jgi:hypothetical protein
VINGTGWTFETVNAMPLCNVFELLNSWVDSPPINELVRAYLGYEGPAVKPTKHEEQLVQSMPVRPYDTIPADIRAIMEAHKVN